MISTETYLLETLGFRCVLVKGEKALLKLRLHHLTVLEVVQWVVSKALLLLLGI
jgi:hypothetical protein